MPLTLSTFLPHRRRYIDFHVMLRPCNRSVFLRTTSAFFVLPFWICCVTYFLCYHFGHIFLLGSCCGVDVPGTLELHREPGAASNDALIISQENELFLVNV